MVHCARIVRYTHRKCQWSKCFHCQKVVWKWSRNSIWHWPYIVYMICRLFLNLIWSLKPAILILGFIIYLYKFIFWFKTIFLCCKFGVFMFGFSSISVYNLLGLFSTKHISWRWSFWKCSLRKFMHTPLHCQVSVLGRKCFLNA